MYCNLDKEWFIGIFSTRTIRALARCPRLALIVLTLCGIVILPGLLFTMLTICALSFIKLGLFEVSGELMLYKMMFCGFLLSVGIILLVTSATIFVWYYGLLCMYDHHFNAKPVTKKLPIYSQTPVPTITDKPHAQ
ncbi:hypothetical protein CBL_10804 [Carabus blaptoides fortunei]